MLNNWFIVVIYEDFFLKFRLMIRLLFCVELDYGILFYLMIGFLLGIIKSKFFMLEF